MTLIKYKEYMKDFFEKYYEKLSKDDISIKRPLYDEDCKMWADDANPNEEWKKWKLVPANVTEQELDELEQEVGVKLPLSMNAFLTTYHHYFEDPIGVNPISEQFRGIKYAWNPVLIKCGYLPFAWDEEHYFIRCMKLAELPNEEACGIYQINHELLFDFEEDTVIPEELEEYMEPLADNLLTYLDDILNGKDKASLMRTLMNELLTVLYDELEIETFDNLERKLEEDYDSVIATMKPIMEMYNVAESDMNDIMEELEYWF